MREVLIAGDGSCGKFTYDEFDLAGLELTEDQKQQIRELEINLNKVITILKQYTITTDKATENFKLLAELLSDNENIKSSKAKNWNKKKFYD